MRMEEASSKRHQKKKTVAEWYFKESTVTQKNSDKLLFSELDPSHLILQAPEKNKALTHHNLITSDSLLSQCLSSKLHLEQM